MLEREVVNRQHRAAAVGGRDHVVEVPERGAESPQQPRKRHGHPDALAPSGEQDRLDSVGNEVGPARDRGQPLLVCDRRQLPQERGDVGLVARTAASEDVRVDDDERFHEARSR